MAHAFVDTSAWFAYINRLDPDHTRIRSLLQTFQGRLITSNFIFDETVTLCLYRLGYRVAAAWPPNGYRHLTAQLRREGWRLKMS